MEELGLRVDDLAARIFPLEADRIALKKLLINQLPNIMIKRTACMRIKSRNNTLLNREGFGSITSLGSRHLVLRSRSRMLSASFSNSISTAAVGSKISHYA